MERGEVVGEHGGGWLASSDAGALWVEHWGDLALVVVDRHGSAGEAERLEVLEEAVASVWSTLTRSRYPAFRNVSASQSSNSADDSASTMRNMPR